MPTKIAISYFKAHCLEVINKLQKDKKPLLLTKRNETVAEILPIDNSIKENSIFGLLKNRAEINSDIISPINEKWDAENE